MGKQTTEVTRALTVPEVCALLRTTRLTVYHLIERGALPAYKVGPYWRIDVDDLERYRERGKADTRAGRARSGAREAAAGVHEADTGDATSAEGDEG